MHRVRAYGLDIESEVELPELLPAVAGAPAQVRVRIGAVTEVPEELDERGFGFWARDEEACHYLEGVGAFLVRGGCEIVVDAAAGAAAEVVRLSILGPAMGLVLQQRGYFVLHASAVEINGEAVAFVGGHGTGKSTTAALLRSAGARVVTDDVSALETRENRTLIHPSYPQLKLWPDALQTLGARTDELPHLHPDFEKRALRFADEFSPDALPLRSIYVLAVGESVATEPLPPQLAFEQILRHWYGARFGPSLFRTLEPESHFLRCASLARSVPVRHLLRPPDLTRTPPSLLLSTLLNDQKDPG